MALEIIGKIHSKLSVQNGVSARGNWSKQEFIVETQEQYPRKVCMNVWGADKVEELGRYNEGEVIKISVNIESREFNNRWYTDVRAWKIERMESQQTQQEGFTPPPTMPDFPSDSGEDDLPF
ncbi:MAG: DUF3127 domain-containing protein [Bacteroidales bacterium]|jgi:hypothetical protein|nr:DUF3127 domain-containing protein [Bacteroidales bacterium]MDD3272534.1 DUF3127 domain-containing protein [Bacteroidales bacterium]MDD4057729.1 DUF3127 domain-containing protein [Bacteroidales bacterium]